jgi:enoyl-[acyl-carrier protein] reductase I
MSGLMSGKRCLIFGVANRRSIAWGIAQALHREGADLFFSYATERLRENVDELVDSLEGGSGYPRVLCDVTKDEEIQALYQEVSAHWDGKLDVMVHCIAFAKTDDLTGNFVDISRDGYMLAHDISAYSLIPCSRYAVPLFEAAGGGSVITLTYMAAERYVEKYNVMATAKAALECNVRYLAAELGSKNVRVNAVSAGPIKTLAASAVKGISAIRSEVEVRAPLRRNVDQNEVGDVALFLASPLSRCVTGEVIYADNGFSIVGISHGG